MNFLELIAKEKPALIKGSKINARKARKVKYLNISLSELEDLNGLEVFTELRSLDCYKCKLISLDVGDCKKLQELRCYTNYISSMRLNDKIQVLYCFSNNLETIDLSGCLDLRELGCGSNRIKQLELCNNKKMKKLFFGNNQVEHIDLRYNTNLEYLWCTGNRLTSIAVPRNCEIDADPNVIISRF